MKKSPKYDAKNFKFRRNYVKPNSRRGIFEFSLPLIFSFWCLVFLFYCEFGLTHANGGNMHAENENMTSLSVCNAKQCDSVYSCVTDREERTVDGLLLQFNVSVTFNDSYNHDYHYDDSKYSHRGTSELQDVVWSFIGYPSLVCAIQTQERGQKPVEQQQNGKNRSAYLNLDEFRNITKQVKAVSEAGRLVNITHRLEPDGTEYNYASAAKDAKVVAHNQEAKGASNILGKDHDKYLRNPCSVGGKFVIIELTEETLVDAVKIANFEHYSSNFKEFELFGSLIYPTDKWVPLGKFVAANVKHAQCFKLAEPKWVRYLKLKLFSHYGSEFYCTLSVVEVYGIDAIERMLEDLIVDPRESGNKELPNSNLTLMPFLVPELGPGDQKINGEVQKVIETMGEERIDEGPRAKIEVRQQKNGRIHADAVLKILMQKVRSLEINLSVLEEYIKELNRRQGDLIPDMDTQLARYSILLEKSGTDIKNLLEWREIMEKGVDDLKSWKTVVSSQVDVLVRENDMLRLDVEKVVTDQASLEKKEIAVLVVSFCFAFFAILKIVSELIFFGASLPSKVYRARKGWILMLVSSSITIFITLLCS